MTRYLITNPGLCNDLARLAPWLEQLRAAGIHFEGPYHLDQCEWQAQLEPADCLLALGGDGTVSAVARHCVSSGALLAILPAGTANDFARSLGIVAASAVALLAEGEESRVDVGRLDGLLFLNVTHIGLGAEVSLYLTGQEKRRWGPWSYLRELLRRLVKRRGFKGKLRFDGSSLYGRWLEIAIANGPCFGGGHRIEQADLRNGKLTLVALRERPLRQLALAVFPARLGLSTSPKLLRVEQVEQVEIKTQRRHLAVSADGEALPHVPHLCYVEPGALRVLCPRSSATLTPRRGAP
ncbi:diacylglycerol kinase family protein [Motiliproteus sp. SC1-56]|uniref:diacylglycerol/lipid kinase family protein n=1 Tax=Motiliproteus sp. SC1-56 TaxID=2799565 RepID=UPI001A8E28A8|nr:diacylglycerol kinase family protein [Motiliproteus sp. SC1-56]